MIYLEIESNGVNATKKINNMVMRITIEYLSLVAAKVSMEVRMPANETSIPFTAYGTSKNFVPGKQEIWYGKQR